MLNYLIIETNHFKVAQDFDVPIVGFFIISPKRKVRSIVDFTSEELQEYILLMKDTRKGMLEVLRIEEVYFFQNEDTSHNFHLWIFPRHSRMEKFGRKIQSVRPIMERAESNNMNQETVDEIERSSYVMGEYMKSIGY